MGVVCRVQGLVMSRDGSTTSASTGVLVKFWNSQDVLYDWEADFKTGTGLIFT